jgi:hypothetical protein
MEMILGYFPSFRNFVSNNQISIMKKLYTMIGLMASLLGFSLSTVAQGTNALDFDGVDDYVSVPDASNFISGKTQISMTCWVNATNTNNATHEGFCGLRDNAAADFYLLRLQNSNKIEARFRNSNGTAYTIASLNSVNPGVWTHYAFTYDGSKIRLYRDGVLTDSATATGSIASTTDSMYIGHLPYNTDRFRLTGQVDEVTLWAKTLSQSDIQCMIASQVNLNANGLKLSYTFNQGAAAGTNTSITTAVDGKGNSDGILNNFALNGPTSNFVGGIVNVNLISASLCKGQSYTVGTQTYTQPGTYVTRIPGTGTCDSVIEVTLTRPVIDTTVTVNGPALKAMQDNAIYQWVNCSQGYAPIQGAGFQNFTPTNSGVYACIVTIGGCSDTSNCRIYNRLGSNNITWEQGLNIYPNPTNGQLNVRADLMKSNFTMTITDINGRVMSQSTGIPATTNVISLQDLANGVYLLNITSEGKTVRTKIVKN